MGWRVRALPTAIVRRRCHPNRGRKAAKEEALAQGEMNVNITNYTIKHLQLLIFLQTIERLG